MMKSKWFYVTIVIFLSLFAIASAQEKKDNKKDPDVLESLSSAMPEPTRILVKFKSTVGQVKREEMMREHNLKKLSKIEQIGVDVLSVGPEHTVQEMVDKLKVKHKDKIEYVEIDEPVPPALVPNDPYYTSQWHLPNISAPTAWDKKTGTGVIIAILDTGIDAAHPDLAPQLVPGWNMYDNNDNTSDIHGHGTKVAGVAAALGNNSAGVSSVSFTSKIMPVRIADANAYGYYSTMASGITWAADHGARVANISYQGAIGSSTVINAAQYMRSKGGVVVCSSGNTGILEPYVASDYVTGVSATASSNTVTSWSSYGSFVDLAAPGSGIYTTVRGGGYGSVSGTSSASPVVAGVYALMMSANSKLSPSALDNIIFSTATDIDAAGKDQKSGWGLVNASAAVTKALETVVASDTTAPTAPSNLKAVAPDSATVDLSWTAASDNVGVTGYNIYRNNSLLKTVGATAVTYRDSSVSANTSYGYEVQAFDAANNLSSKSNLASVTVPAATTNTTALQINNVMVASKSGSSATIVWQTTKPATGYVLYGTSKNSLTLTSAIQAAATSQSVTLSGLKNKTTYYYKVIATDLDGNIVSSSVSNFKTMPR